MTQREETTMDEMDADEMAAALMQAVQSGATLKDLHGVSQDLMDGIYAFAYRFYQQGRLDDAEVFFRFLCIYDFYHAEYAMGLAAVLQLKKEYAKAIDLYALAYSLSKDDYRPMFHTGQCHLLMGRAPLARRCFSIVAEGADDVLLKQKAASYLRGLDEVAAAPQAPPAPSKSDHE
ncbi:type III secretion system translocator chaperone SicA [Burkholderia ubonensis]|uniref:type III secretion system translocator chaperone SicA n=1 Tax=Burkholderia ubonensis TaxID=101571 RepID=UPI000758B28D|nr:type III secretion system translocator chaperone SicA [Burkholderia ubonensis]KWK77684.1 chaperone protein SicA [Burkholderia ubonensis]